MSRAITAGELKAHVRALVKAFGGVDAAAVELEVSAERISQWQRTTCPDQMPFLCICRLEAELGRPIVTGAAARAAQGEAPEVLTSTVVAAVGSSATALRLVSDMDRDGVRNAGEIRDVQRAAQENLRQAEALVDAAGGLRAGAAE